MFPCNPNNVKFNLFFNKKTNLNRYKIRMKKKNNDIIIGQYINTSIIPRIRNTFYYGICTINYIKI